MFTDDLLSTKEAAEYLDIDRRSVSRLIHKKVLEGKKIGRDWFVTRQSVEAYKQASEGLDKHDPRRGKHNE